MKSEIMPTTNNNDEDFIDIEVTTSSSSSSSSSPPPPPPQNHPNREFEFQMSCSDSRTTSTADDLFYKGKLLPLYLPPRLQMVQKLLQTTTADTNDACFTPADSISSSSSCNNNMVSPAESCRVSCEVLNPSESEYFFNWSSTIDESRSFIHHHHHNHNHSKKSCWSNKLKLMKQPSFLTQKLKTSHLYLKSLFIKSTACNSKNREIIEKKCDDNMIQSRRSFSGVIKRHSPTKCLSSSSSSSSSSGSSSFSGNSNIVFDLHLFKRSSSDPSEIETSIQAAIAHCKNSQRPITHSHSTC